MGPLALAWPRRLLTSCAHRLRKPHRRIGPLTPSVTRRSRKERSTPTPSVARPALRRSRSPYEERDSRPAASAPDLAITGLGRWSDRKQDAFRWLDLHALRPKQTRARSLVGLPARIPYPFRPPRIVLFVVAERPATEGYPAKRCVPFGPPRPGGRCVYPTSAIDIRHVHPTDRVTLDLRRAKASFDDEPPASALRRWPRSPGCQAPSGPVGARDHELARASLPRSQAF